jgi:RND family efflux transporter MFP subunit
MKKTLYSSGKIILTMVVVFCAGIVVNYLWQFYMEAPWTRDGRICADVVHIAPDVSGIINEVLVKDNQIVHKGDVLFRIDTKRFYLDLKQAKAHIESSEATLELAKRDSARYQKLALSDVVSLQRKQQADRQLKMAESDYELAVAAKELAELNISRANVTAPADGKITNFSLCPGNYATAGKAVAALVDSKSFYVMGYFEETKLSRIHKNDPVKIEVMGEPEVLTGHVVSIAGGIQDSERSDTEGALANVAPTFRWVRLAQRIPVRITFDDIPAGVTLVAGRTATVSVASSLK